MTRLIWDDRPAMNSGVDHGILYPPGSEAIVWNGLLAVNDSSSDSGITVAYQDGQKYIQRRSYTAFTGSIRALTFPDEIVGKVFDLCYRVMKDVGYELHLLYNVTAVMSSVANYNSLGGEVDVVEFEWNISTLPILVNDNRETSHIIVDSSQAYPEVLVIFENLLYGTESSDPRIPHPDEVFDIFETNARFRIIDNGDGTWTAIGPDDWIEMLSSTEFQITSPSAIFIDSDTYQIGSW